MAIYPGGCYGCCLAASRKTVRREIVCNQGKGQHGRAPPAPDRIANHHQRRKTQHGVGVERL
jgi:hypothetical protein